MSRTAWYSGNVPNCYLSEKSLAASNYLVHLSIPTKALPLYAIPSSPNPLLSHSRRARATLYVQASIPKKRSYYFKPIVQLLLDKCHTTSQKKTYSSQCKVTSNIK